MAVQSFKDLHVWQRAMSLVADIYTLTAQLPTHERFGLASQLQRAAISIPSNIAEGSRRSTRADFRQFCFIARGSAAELETQLLLVRSLYASIPVANALTTIADIQRMLTMLTRRLKVATTNEKRKTIH